MHFYDDIKEKIISLLLSNSLVGVVGVWDAGKCCPNLRLQVLVPSLNWPRLWEFHTAYLDISRYLRAFVEFLKPWRTAMKLLSETGEKGISIMYLYVVEESLATHLPDELWNLENISNKLVHLVKEISRQNVESTYCFFKKWMCDKTHRDRRTSQLI